MNGVYVVWGLMIPNSQAKEVWNDYIRKLELYVNVVSYSDAVILPLKIISMILVKWCCCECKKMTKKDDAEDVIDKNCDICENKQAYYDSKYAYNSKRNGISEFHMNP